MNFAAKTFTAWRFKPEELILIKVDKPCAYRLEPPLSFRTMPDSPERWQIDLVMLAKKFGALLYAPFDLDSQPAVSRGCVSILICLDDWPHWQKAVHALGTTLPKLDKDVSAGAYGLTQLLSDGQYLYWRCASRQENHAFIKEMVDQPPRYRGREAAVYETFAIAQIIAGDRPDMRSSAFSAEPNPAVDMLRTLKAALDETGWDDAKADLYASKQFGVPHWDELEASDCKRFLSLLENVLQSRSKTERKPQ